VRIAADLTWTKALVCRVTAVEVRKWTNGATLLFRPARSSYLSQKEERARGRLGQGHGADSLILMWTEVDSPGTGKSGYRSPEQEARDLQLKQAPYPHLT